jgi:biopolymer transport protein ExbD
MTPLIDVIFLLLIFFLCTANFRPPEQSLPADVTTSQQEGAANEIDPQLAELDEIFIQVQSEGEQTIWLLTFAGDPQSGRQLRSREELRSVLRELASIRGDLPVFIQVSSQVPMQDVVTTVDFCREAGLSAVSLLASSKSANSR